MFKFFTIPVHDSGRAETELNGFLSGHRILAVERRLIEAGQGSYWAFCVDYLESGSGSTASRSASSARVRIDYREKLTPEQFETFARLRQWRKEVADGEAVPVYTVFTNEQLAKMVENRVRTRTELEAIAGVGDARIEKYGARILDRLNFAWGGEDAASGEPL